MRNGADLNGDNLRISRACLRITVELRLGLGTGLGLGLGFVLPIFVYKLLEKVTKYGSIM